MSKFHLAYSEEDATVVSEFEMRPGHVSYLAVLCRRCGPLRREDIASFVMYNDSEEIEELESTDKSPI